MATREANIPKQEAHDAQPARAHVQPFLQVVPPNTTTEEKSAPTTPTTPSFENGALAHTIDRWHTLLEFVMHYSQRAAHSLEDLPGRPRPAEALLRATVYRVRNSSAKKVATTILLHGEPGTGKTYLVKALANSLHASLFVVPPSRVIGASVNTGVYDLFNEACSLARYTPVILLFDHCELLFTSSTTSFQQKSPSPTTGSSGTPFEMNAASGSGFSSSSASTSALLASLEDVMSRNPTLPLFAVFIARDLTSIDKRLVDRLFDIKIEAPSPTDDERAAFFETTIRRLAMEELGDAIPELRMHAQLRALLAAGGSPDWLMLTSEQRRLLVSSSRECSFLRMARFLDEVFEEAALRTRRAAFRSSFSTLSAEKADGAADTPSLRTASHSGDAATASGNSSAAVHQLAVPCWGDFARKLSVLCGNTPNAPLSSPVANSQLDTPIISLDHYIRNRANSSSNGFAETAPSSTGPNSDSVNASTRSQADFLLDEAARALTLFTDSPRDSTVQTPTAGTSSDTPRAANARKRPSSSGRKHRSNKRFSNDDFLAFGDDDVEEEDDDHDDVDVKMEDLSEAQPDDSDYTEPSRKTVKKKRGFSAYSRKKTMLENIMYYDKYLKNPTTPDGEKIKVAPSSKHDLEVLWFGYMVIDGFVDLFDNMRDARNYVRNELGDHFKRWRKAGKPKSKPDIIKTIGDIQVDHQVIKHSLASGHTAKRKKEADDVMSIFASASAILESQQESQQQAASTSASASVAAAAAAGDIEESMSNGSTGSGGEEESAPNSALSNLLITPAPLTFPHFLSLAAFSPIPGGQFPPAPTPFAVALNRATPQPQPPRSPTSHS